MLKDFAIGGHDGFVVAQGRISGARGHRIKLRRGHAGFARQGLGGLVRILRFAGNEHGFFFADAPYQFHEPGR